MNMKLGHQDTAGSRNGSKGDTMLLDPGKINSIRSLDPDGTAGLFKKIVELFIEKSPELIQRITSALEAGDAEGVFRAAHSLKSSSATIGAMGLSETCGQLETIGRQGALEGARELSQKIQSELHQVCVALNRMREGM